MINWFENLKIKSKMLLGFGIIVVIGMLLGITGIVSTQILLRENNNLFELTNQDSRFNEILIRHYVWRNTLTESVLNETEFTGSLNPDTCALGSWLNSDESKKVTDPEILSVLQKIDEPHAYIHHEAAAVVNYMKNGDIEMAKRHLADNIQPRLDIVVDNLSSVETRYSVLMKEGGELMTSTGNIATIIIIVAVIAALIVAMGLSFLISGDITKSLKVNIDNLTSISKTVRNSADQISEASASLAAGSSQQAAAIEETSATMNETESMVARNAENTQVASRIADGTIKSVTEAGEHMTELMEFMTELKESSDKVGRIVKTIDEIAFQTNLLAINATVEAARAGGDAGRSFAVVAEEVRTLAQKSATASKETAEIIEKNISLTGTSKAAAEKVLVIAQKNAQQTVELNKLIAEISAASEEQASGIKQINIAVSQVEQTTQRNAAIAEENSAASQELHDEVIMLDQAIEKEAKLI